MAKHFSEEERKLIEKELLEEAKERFEKYGLRKTSIEELTDAVGISKGSFYSFFNSKGDLFVAVYFNERDRLDNELTEKYDCFKGSMAELIQNFEYDFAKRLEDSTLLSMIYDDRSFKIIYDRTARKRLLERNLNKNQQLIESFQRWMDERGEYGISAEMVVKLLRSTNFLKFHELAIGIDSFEEVVKNLIDAIAGAVESSKC